MKRILLTVIVCCVVAPVWAQEGWPDEAKEKNVLYTDAMKAGNNEGALEPLEWLLTNNPELHNSFYINGVKIYDALQKKETDAAKKKAYQARCLELYDMRITHFGKEADVLNRKAYKAYKFLKDDKSKTKELYDLFEKVYELNGNKMMLSNMVAYMDVIRRYKTEGGLTDDDILEKYGNITDILNYHISQYEQKGKDPAPVKKSMEFIDKMLIGMLENMDCETIASKMAPALDKQPADIAVAKRIIALSLTYKCTDQDFFLKAAEIVFDEEPTFGMAKLLAVKSDAARNYAKAAEYYQKAVELADTDKQKSDVHYGLANHYRARGMKSRARASALEAVKLDSSKKDAYKLIGDLYMSSWDDCRKGEKKVEDRAIFFAAYRMYQRAGNSRGMANAEKQFPSMEDIFTENMKEGADIQVGCWINETVTVKRRPSS